MINKKINFDIIFILFSLIFLITSVFIYGNRFYKYYTIEKKSDEVKKLDEILKNNVVYSGNGLYKENNEYFFKGTEINNFVYFSGKIFRIMGIDEKGNIKLISNDISTIIYVDKENNNLKKYLNSYYNTLNQKFLADVINCEDELDKKISCNNKKNSKISTLSIYDYNLAGSDKSYLNNQKFIWLVNKDSSKNSLYIDELGNVNSLNNEASLGIRPVIALKSNVEIKSGNGSSSDPYIIDEVQNNIKNVYEGSYLLFNDKKWKIINKDKCTKILLVDEMNNYKFSLNKNIFDVFDNGSIADYLYNNFILNISNDYLCQTNFYNGLYDNDVDSILNSNYQSNFGLSNVGDMIIDGQTYYTMTMASEVSELVYVVLDNGKLRIADISEEFMMKPVVSIKNDINIEKGIGTFNDPYVLE